MGRYSLNQIKDSLTFCKTFLDTVSTDAYTKCFLDVLVFNVYGCAIIGNWNCECEYNKAVLQRSSQ